MTHVDYLINEVIRCMSHERWESAKQLIDRIKRNCEGDFTKISNRINDELNEIPFRNSGYFCHTA